MQSPPPPPTPLRWSGEIPPPVNVPSAAVPAAPARAGRRAGRLTVVLAAGVVAAAVGVLLGGRVSAEDALSAARQALHSGDPARAVSLDESVSGRSGVLTLFDPDATTTARHEGQLARVAWAQQLGAQGRVDGALAALKQVGEPSLIATAAQTRSNLLLSAATAALQQGHAALALQRLDQAVAGTPPTTMLARIAALRATAEVSAAHELVASGHFEDAIRLLDDASANGAAAAARPLYPSTLLGAGREQLAAMAFQDAAVTLQRLVDQFGTSAEGRTARSLLRGAQPVSGTLVDGSGHGASGRIRLASHFTVVSGGYVTGGPFFYGTADGNGDFTLGAVPVGGPYVLEYFRGGGWQTLVDPRTYQPANTITVKPLVPVDLTFIVIPG